MLKEVYVYGALTFRTSEGFSVIKHDSRHVDCSRNHTAECTVSDSSPWTLSSNSEAAEFWPLLGCGLDTHGLASLPGHRRVACESTGKPPAATFHIWARIRSAVAFHFRNASDRFCSKPSTSKRKGWTQGIHVQPVLDWFHFFRQPVLDRVHVLLEHV